MKVTESMFRDFVSTTFSVEEIADSLTMAGFELEEITLEHNEKVMDINIMANRGDGASVLGLSREFLAKNIQSKPTELYEMLSNDQPFGDEGRQDAHQLATIRVDSELCDRFSARVFEGVRNCDSPDWLKDRLTKLGLRPISLIVDLTNYVMLETGQPMHAYDLDKVSGKTLIAGCTKSKTELKTLDEIDRVVESGHLLIWDATSPVGIAGVMGGLETEVSSETSRIILESAHFGHRTVRRTRKSLGMQTDASYRFERFVDPAGTVRALNRFASLLKEITGVSPVPGILDINQVVDRTDSIKVRPERCAQLLGMDVDHQASIGILKRLGFQVKEAELELHVIPPSWRIDIIIEDDVAEEIGRMLGYEKIPEQLPIGSTPVGGTHEIYEFVEEIREALLKCGVNQIVSHSLRSEHPLDRNSNRVVVRNPHAPEIALLRNTQLPCLADALQRNGSKEFVAFETGRVFDEDREFQQLGILASGSLELENWVQKAPPESDYFWLSGVLQTLLKQVNREYRPTACLVNDRRFHPGRVARLGEFGIFGQIHPIVAEQIGIPESTVLAELDLEALYDAPEVERQYKPLHRHPSTKRDIAVLVSKLVPFCQVEEAVTKAAGSDLESCNLFDVYEGKGIEEGYHSLALSLRFRKGETFTDEEANLLRDKIVLELASLGAKLR